MISRLVGAAVSASDLAVRTTDPLDGDDYFHTCRRQ